MLEAVNGFFGNFARTIRFVDLVDVIVVSAILYLFINWLRRSATKRLIVTVSVFSVLYLTARLLDMYLTEMIISMLAVVFIIAAVVVFQSDIRRMVEAIGTWNFFRRNSAVPLTPKTVDLLTEACLKMAEQRTGALIAIMGKESWDYPTHGGIELGGNISLPLLYSIFSTKSPGHDGAVLIKGDRIEKFGVHLTLSTNLSEIGQRGTRHAAGLGLSEHCDAFVIVVSEERGTISVAEGGRLTTLNSAGRLKEELTRFWNMHYSKKDEPWLAWWKNHNLPAAAMAFGISVMLWFLFAYQSDIVYRTFAVPIEFRNLKTNLELKPPVPAEARVTVTGSEQAFRLLDPAAIAISVDLADFDRSSTSIMINNDNINLPSGIKLYDVEPKDIKLRASRMRYVRVPVEVQTRGNLPGNIKLRQVSTEPKEIVLMVSDRTSGIPRTVLTEPVNLRNIYTNTVKSARLIIPSGTRLPADQPSDCTIKILVSR